jgi:hypothetical protein
MNNQIIQNKPNLRKAKMIVNLVKTMTNNNELRTIQNKPNQTQFIVSLSNLPVVSLSNLFYPPPAVSKGTLARTGRTGGERETKGEGQGTRDER